MNGTNLNLRDLLSIPGILFSQLKSLRHRRLYHAGHSFVRLFIESIKSVVKLNDFALKPFSGLWVWWVVHHVRLLVVLKWFVSQWWKTLGRRNPFHHWASFRNHRQPSCLNLGMKIKWELYGLSTNNFVSNCICKVDLVWHEGSA